MEMNVSTSAIDKGIRAVRRHTEVIYQLTRALKHNVVLAKEGYYDDNYLRVLKAVEGVDGSISRLLTQAERAQRNLDRLKDRVDDYNESRYRG